MRLSSLLLLAVLCACSGKQDDDDPAPVFVPSLPLVLQPTPISVVDGVVRDSGAVLDCSACCERPVVTMNGHPQRVLLSTAARLDIMFAGADLQALAKASPAPIPDCGGTATIENAFTVDCTGQVPQLGTGWFTKTGTYSSATATGALQLTYRSKAGLHAVSVWPPKTNASPYSSFAVTFDAPVDPAAVVPEGFSFAATLVPLSGNMSVYNFTGKLALETDGRTITYTPDLPFPQGTLLFGALALVRVNPLRSVDGRAFCPSAELFDLTSIDNLASWTSAVRRDDLPEPPNASLVDGKVTLRWERVTAATRYQLYRHVPGAQPDAAPIASPTTASYVDDAAPAGTWSYRVAVVMPQQTSQKSAESAPVSVP